MIAHHIVAQVSLVRVISWSSHDERISSTLSSPFPSTSSSHSSLTSCTSSCTSSTTLRAVAKLRTSPERRWTHLTTPTSSHELDSEVAGSNKDTPRIQPKPKTQLSRTGRPAGGQESTKEIEKGTLFDHEDVTHSTRTGRPVCGSESTLSCVFGAYNN